MSLETPRKVETPHSGNLPEGQRETPVRVFAETSLESAHEQALIITPDSAASLAETAVIPKQKVETKGSRFTMKQRVIAGLATAGLAIGAGALAVNLGKEAEPTTEPVPVEPAVPNPDAEAPAEPTTPEVEAPVTGEYEIPANLDAVEFANYYLDNNLSAYESLQNNDTIDEYYTFLSTGADLNDFVNTKIGELAPSVFESTFTDSFLSNPENAQKIEGLSKRMGDSLYFWSLTFESGNPEDVEPFQTNRDVISATEVESTDSGRVIEIEYVENDNRDLNRAGTEYASFMPDYTPTQITVTTQIENGVEKIDSYTRDSE